MREAEVMFSYSVDFLQGEEMFNMDMDFSGSTLPPYSLGMTICFLH